MKDNLRKVLGDRIKNIRVSKGLSQRQLGIKLGVANSTISAVERGERNLTMDMLQRISDALEVDIFTLFRLETENDNMPEMIREVESTYSIPKNYLSAFEQLYNNGIRFKNIQDYYYTYVFIQALNSKTR